MIVCAFVTKEQHKILSQNRKALSGKQSLQRNRAYRWAEQASWAARNRIREMWCVGCHVLCITVCVCASVLCSEGAGDRIDTVTALFPSVVVVSWFNHLMYTNNITSPVCPQMKETLLRPLLLKTKSKSCIFKPFCPTLFTSCLLSSNSYWISIFMVIPSFV